LGKWSTFTGCDAAIADIKKLRLFSPDQFAVALYQEGQIELTEVKKRTPVDTGALRASERIEGPIREGRRIYIYIVAGGPSVEYAFAVHEDLEAFHKIGEAKYIERPLNESAPYMSDRIAKRIDLNAALKR
jgi:hypothetical protein